jgi:hypothetical protein
METATAFVFEVGELTEPIFDWRVKRPEIKPEDRGRVQPRFSMIDPKGEK